MKKTIVPNENRYFIKDNKYAAIKYRKDCSRSYVIKGLQNERQIAPHTYLMEQTEHC